MLNEMLDFGHGVTGLALNLEETEVGVIILGDYTQLKEGDEVRTTGKLLQVPVGKGLLGRVVNTLGRAARRQGPDQERRRLSGREDRSRASSGASPVSQPVQTGIMAIDAMIPIGRGQRELIIGDRSTGKTTICIDTIISQARLNKAAEAAGDKDYRPLYCIYVAIGQKQSNIARDHHRPRGGRRDALHHRRRLPGFRLGHQPVPGAVRGRGHGRVVHGQRHGRADHLRRSVQARRGLPAGLAGAEAAVGPRGLSRATSSTSTAACSSGRRASARSTATAR